MNASAQSSYATAALEHFDHLLVELARSGASRTMLRKEGFSSGEIIAVTQLVGLENQGELDGGTVPAETGVTASPNAAPADLVTAPT